LFETVHFGKESIAIFKNKSLLIKEKDEKMKKLGF